MMYENVKIRGLEVAYKTPMLTLISNVVWSSTIQGHEHWFVVWLALNYEDIDPSPRDKQYLYGAFRSVGRDV